MENQTKRGNEEIIQDGKNNVDLAIEQLRTLQSMFYRHDLSDNDLFNYTTKIIDTMEKASKEINTNYAEISSKLTKLWNTGKPD